MTRVRGRLGKPALFAFHGAGEPPAAGGEGNWMPASESYIKQLVTDRQEHYSNLHKRIREVRGLRYLEHEVKVPSVYETTSSKVRNPIVPDVILRVVASLTADDPVVRVPPAGQTQKAIKQSSQMERWSGATLARLQEEQNRSVLDMAMDSACGNGMAVLKVLHKPDAWHGEPRRKRKQGKELIEPENEGDEPTYKRFYEYEDAENYTQRLGDWRKTAPFPLTLTDIDPLTFLPVLRGATPTEVVEITQRPLLPAMKAFGVRRGDGGRYYKLRPGEAFPEDESVPGGAQTVRCVEHWDERFVTYTLEDTIVDQFEHKYPRLPYFHFAGFSTSGPRPEDQYQSIIENFRHLVPALDRLLTMQMNWAYLAAWPFLVADPNADFGQGPREDGTMPPPPVSLAAIEPGTILQGVRFLEPPNVNMALGQLEQLIQQFIDRSAIAAVMFGQGAGISSGYMAAQLITAAQLVYKPILKHARMSYAQLMRFIWQLVEMKVRQPVYVWGSSAQRGAREWIALGPDDIDGYYACEVDLEPLLPTDEVIQGQHAAAMVGAGLWSKERGMGHVGVEQPDAEQEQILAEKFQTHPEIENRLMLAVAKEAGLMPPDQPPPQGPQGPLLFGPNGEPLPLGGPGGPMGGPMMPPGTEIPGAMPGMPQVGMPMQPGMNMPLVPPPPTGGGGMPGRAPGAARLPNTPPPPLPR